MDTNVVHILIHNWTNKNFFSKAIFPSYTLDYSDLNDQVKGIERQRNREINTFTNKQTENSVVMIENSFHRIYCRQ